MEQRQPGSAGADASPTASTRSQADSADDDVILVDANDAPVGTLAKLDAHRLGLRHRAISVIVGDGNGRFLLHRRAAGKYHSAGLWTNTCCSHPRPGEATLDAAARRLNEEMGLTCPLHFLFTTHYRAPVSNGLIEDEIVHVFGGRFDGAPRPDPAEVSEWCWKPASELAREMAERPESYTVWFQKFCRQFWTELLACGRT